MKGGCALKPYAYVGNSPLNSTDPSGLCWPSFACGIENAWNDHAKEIAQYSAGAAAILSGAALGCAVLAAVTVVGEAVCGVIEVGALVAGAVATAADITLAAEGKGSWWNVAFDLVAAGSGGGGFFLKQLRTESGFVEGAAALGLSPFGTAMSCIAWIQSAYGH